MVTGKIDGGTGSNEIDFSPYATPVTFNLQTNTFSGVGSGTFTRVQNMVGTATATDLVGPNANTTWDIKGSDAETVNGILFTNVKNLTGGSKADTFLFSAAAAVTGTIDGGTGTDLLNYSLYSSSITVDLTADTATGSGGIANLEAVIGTSGAGDTLIGPDAVNTWTITGSNSGNINGSFTFSGIENLTGGANDDTFTFSNGKGFNGHIDGGDTTNFNTLDYSAYTTGINVDLTAGTATNITGGVTNITDILGGSGSDTLTGNTNGNLIWGNGGNDTINGMGGTDILVGGPGNDTITGGADRDLIMGGAGNDILTGGGGDDIIISGTTTFDSDGTTQNSILNFWNNLITNSDGTTTPITPPLPFATQVAELRAGTTGVAGLPTLDSTNVFNDTSSDKLTGGMNNAGEFDWFFANLSGSAADTITDLASGNALN
jgi:hypothetical protein